MNARKAQTIVIVGNMFEVKIQKHKRYWVIHGYTLQALYTWRMLCYCVWNAARDAAIDQEEKQDKSMNKSGECAFGVTET